MIASDDADGDHAAGHADIVMNSMIMMLCYCCLMMLVMMMMTGGTSRGRTVRPWGRGAGASGRTSETTFCELRIKKHDFGASWVPHMEAHAASTHQLGNPAPPTVPEQFFGTSMHCEGTDPTQRKLFILSGGGGTLQCPFHGGAPCPPVGVMLVLHVWLR